MNWKHPPIIKIYEAVGAVADGRVEVDGNTAKVYSSSRNKFYTVSYDPSANAIMANDNGSYWQGYLGYPAVAFLLATGVLEYRREMGELLKDVAWKDINQKFKNDFEKTLELILGGLNTESRQQLEACVAAVDSALSGHTFALLGPKQLPPSGY